MSYGQIFEAKTGKPVSELETLADIERAAAHINTGESFPPWTEEKKREFRQVMEEQIAKIADCEASINSCDNTPPWTEEEKRNFLRFVDNVRILPAARERSTEVVRASLNHPELLTSAEIDGILDDALKRPMPPWRRKRRFPFSLIGFVLGIVAGCLITRFLS